MADQSYDVIIIGGGPAGLLAGIVCARHQLRTLLVEKKTFPINKPCGEGIMPTGLACLEKLGVQVHLSSKPHSPFQGIRYISPQGRTAEATFAEGVGWGMQRTVLSEGLYECAKQWPNLTIVEKTSPRLNRDLSGNLEVKVEEQWFQPNLLIGADGLFSQVRHWAGLEGPKQSLRRWGVRQHIEHAPWCDLVEVHWKPGVEAYVTPTSPHSIGIAFLWDFKKRKSIQGGSQLFSSLLEAFPRLKSKIQGSEFLDTPLAIGPFHRVATSPVASNIILMGDAAGYLDAITGEGISLATEQALALEKIVIPDLLQDHPPSQKTLHQYRHAYQKILTPYTQVTQLVLWLRQHPWLLERVISSLNPNPDIFQHLLSANMGTTPFWIAQPKQWIRFGKGVWKG